MCLYVCAEQSLNTLPLQVKGAPTGLTGLQVHKKQIRKKSINIQVLLFQGKNNAHKQDTDGRRQCKTIWWEELNSRKWNPEAASDGHYIITSVRSGRANTVVWNLTQIRGGHVDSLLAAVLRAKIISRFTLNASGEPSLCHGSSSCLTSVLLGRPRGAMERRQVRQLRSLVLNPSD